MLLELGPDRELCGMIGAERKGGDGFKADIAGSERIEQLRRPIAEAQALPPMALGGAEAESDGPDRAVVDQCRDRDEFVGGMHRDADRRWPSPLELIHGFSGSLHGQTATYGCMPAL
ncbi:MAG TPA: hypothetical protein VGR45_07830 [Stellaceae bacterium]|nr:hypothetical protein [Stellaceae bacterium]